MIPPEINAEIQYRLERAAQEHQVRILMAIESGSRAWGFASPNSDYDVRFIYVHAQDWYLAVDLEEKRDVIEYPIVDDIDLNGWDLRKALHLFGKSNPGFVEWIQSPIEYRSTGCFRERALALLPEVYACDRGIHHYLSMAKNNYRNHLQSEEVLLKKYFYALRPLLAVRWIEHHQAPPPLAFSTLLDAIADQRELREAIDILLAQKMAAPEMSRGPQIPVISDFIRKELQRVEQILPHLPSTHASLEPLNSLFRELLHETSAGSITSG